jgi:6-pyruvoyltetrahydropterin/6-carboxytetrahydropterin synthase
MLQLTKIFRFETAHAIHHYQGSCRNIHGHSYKLQVTVTSPHTDDNDIAAPGFIFDFKELKKLVLEGIIVKLDHKLVLSQAYLDEYEGMNAHENLVVWQAEPTAENMLIYIRRELQKILPATTRLVSLKLYETEDSFAEWINRQLPQCY